MRALPTLLLLALPAAAQVAARAPWVAQDPSPDHLFAAPKVAPLGGTDIDVYPNGYRVVGGRFIPATRYPLVEAIKAAEIVFRVKRTMVVLTVHGQIPGFGMQIGGGDAGIKAYRAYWPSASIQVAIRGASGPSVDRIGGFAVLSHLSNNVQTPGTRVLRVENVEIRSSAFSNAIVSTPRGTQQPRLPGGGFARIQIYGCRLGRGTGRPKWGSRLHGRCSWDYRNNTYDYVTEHCHYADSPQGDSFFIGNTMAGATRTMLQVVNRARDNPGPSGWGYLLVQDNVAANIDNDGGSDFTVAGHLGVVIFRGNRSLQLASQRGAQGSIVVWTDANKGMYRNGRGYTTDKVIVQGHTVRHPNADRDHVALSGVERVEIRGSFDIAGNRTAFHFESPFGGPIRNGGECFFLPAPLSRYPGFKAALKVKRRNVVLTNVQVDGLRCQ